VLWFLFMIIYV